MKRFANSPLHLTHSKQNEKEKNKKQQNEKKINWAKKGEKEKSFECKIWINARIINQRNENEFPFSWFIAWNDGSFSWTPAKEEDWSLKLLCVFVWVRFVAA